MAPQDIQPNQELTPDQVDEQACGQRIDYWLKKYGCVLKGQLIMNSGELPMIRVGVVKIPAEVRKQMKEAEKHGRPIQPA